MFRVLVVSLVGALLSTVVGCSTQAPPAKAPAAAEVARDNASWSPPDEVALTFGGASEARESGGGIERRRPQAVAFKPTRQERPTRGAVLVHATRD